MVVPPRVVVHRIRVMRTSMVYENFIAISGFTEYVCFLNIAIIVGIFYGLSDGLWAFLV